MFIRFMIFISVFIGFNEELIFAKKWLSATDSIRKCGFDAAEYDVISQNYTLKVYRIINHLPDEKKKPYTSFMSPWCRQ